MHRAAIQPLDFAGSARSNLVTKPLLVDSFESGMLRMTSPFHTISIRSSGPPLWTSP